MKQTQTALKGDTRARGGGVSCQTFNAFFPEVPALNTGAGVALPMLGSQGSLGDGLPRPKKDQKVLRCCAGPMSLWFTATRHTCSLHQIK